MATILVADDDAHMVRLIAMWLGRNGHTVIEATDGEMAQRALLARSIDLIVSDVNMPKMDGIDLVRWARAHLSASIPILLLSSRCDQSSMATAVAGFGVRVHPKPFSPSRLMEEINRLLSVDTGTGVQP
jgi:two-component system chemotaxis response regulator CheY